MKTYCKNCLAKNKNSSGPCSKCENEIVPSLKGDEEIRPFIQRLHKRTNTLRHYISHSMSFLVIGAILLIIAFFFYYLSFSSSVDKETSERIYVLNTGCSEFWVSMVCLTIGGISFLGGLIVSLVIYRLKRQVLSDVEQIRETGSLETKPVKLLIVVWIEKLVASLKHLRWKINYEKTHKANKEGK